MVLISLTLALISIIIYGIIWINENINNKEHEKGLMFLIITLIGLLGSLIFYCI